MADNRLTTPLLNTLRGAPALIFLAMIVREGPQTTRSLCLATGYSDKIVRQGLARLQEIGLVYNDEALRAWYLLPGSALLGLLQTALNTAVSPAAPPHRPPQPDNKPPAGPPTGANNGAAAEESSALAEASWAAWAAADAGPAHAAVDFAAMTEDFAVVTEEPAPPARHAAGPGDQRALKWAVMAEENAADAEHSSFAAAKSSASRAPDLPPYLTTTTTTYSIPPAAAVSSKVAPQTRASPDADGRRRAVARWLKAGGIAYRSTKMTELLAADLDPDFVKAHVLERLAWERGLVKEIENFGVGLLVRKLTDGDPPPPARCRVCLHRPDNFGRCQCHLESVIKR